MPVILRPCRWGRTDFARLQAVPKDARAVTEWPNEDAAFDDAAGMVPSAAKLITAALILLFVELVWLAARRRKNWARMVLLAALALSILSIAEALRIAGWQFTTVVDVVSALLTALGLYFSFTGDARDWFRSPPS